MHWGREYQPEPSDRQRDLARKMIDAGADIVVGHGPHYSLPVEVYKGKPIFYGVSNLSFHTGHGGLAHGDWIGMLIRIVCGRGGLEGATFQFVRHNEHNETYLCQLDQEAEALADIVVGSAKFGAQLAAEGNQVRVGLKS